MEVNNQFRVEFAVNGKPVPCSIGSFLELSEAQNVQTKVPTLKFVYNDPENILHDYAPLVDGTTVTCLLHSDYGFDYGAPYAVTYRITGSEIEIDGSKLKVTGTGVYDSIKYLAEVVKGSYKGTSAEVIGKLAGECGLQYKGPEGTNDSMVWRPNRETYSDFAKTICNHGQASGNSIMALGVTDKGKLIYKNLDTLVRQPPTKNVFTGTPDMITQGFIPAIGYKATNLSGLSNIMYNYGAKLVQETMEGAGKIFDSINMSSFSNFPNINSAVSGAIGFVRSEFLPAAMGNQHDKYFEAENTNRRGRQSFNNRIEFTTANSTGLELFDVIGFAPTLPTNNQISSLLLGNYIVCGKVKYLARNQYFEKIQAVNQGYSQNFGGELFDPSAPAVPPGQGGTP